MDNMSFGKFIWYDNPENLRIISQSNISTKLLPYNTALTESTGCLPRRIIGNGYFLGEPAYFYAEKLHQMQMTREVQKLSIPFWDNMDCLLLRVETVPQDESTVWYEFEFIEVNSNPVITPTESAEVLDLTLFEMAEQLGISVYTLMRLNPEINDPYDIGKESIWIA